MKVGFLTRENVASHLQKYRESLKKNEEELRQNQHMNAIMPLNRIPPSGPGETSNGRFVNNNNNDHQFAQPLSSSSVPHPGMLSFHRPPLQNPTNPHLLEPSTTTNSPPPPLQSHFTVEDSAFWSQALHHHPSLQMQNHYYNHHLARQLMQMRPPEQNFNFGHAPPRNESNMQQHIIQNLTSRMQQLNQNLTTSGSFYGGNMQQFDQNLSLETSYGRNMQQQQITQNLTSGDNKQLDQNLASGSNMQQQQITQSLASSSCYVTTTNGGGNDGIIIMPEGTPVIGDHDEFCGNPDDQFDHQVTSHTDTIDANLDYLSDLLISPENDASGSSTFVPGPIN